jgi:hypothetical protein
MSKTTIANTELVPAFDDQMHADRLEEMNIATQQGRRAEVALGLYCYEIKDYLNHSEFGPWLAKWKPNLARKHSKSKCWQPNYSLDSAMRMAKSAVESTGATITAFLESVKSSNPRVSGISHCGELLLLNDVPKPLAALRESICEKIDGKSKYQIISAFKQVDDFADGSTGVKRGRKSGEGGRKPDLKGTIDEVAAALKKKTLRSVGKAADELEKAGVYFIALSDGEITAAVAALERTAKCMNAWLAMPATKRDATEIQKLWKTL